MKSYVHTAAAVRKLHPTTTGPVSHVDRDIRDMRDPELLGLLILSASPGWSASLVADKVETAREERA